MIDKNADSPKIKITDGSSKVPRAQVTARLELVSANSAFYVQTGISRKESKWKVLKELAPGFKSPEFAKAIKLSRQKKGAPVSISLKSPNTLAFPRKWILTASAGKNGQVEKFILQGEMVPKNAATRPATTSLGQGDYFQLTGNSTLFQTFMEHNTGLAWINDQHGVLRFMNPSFQAYFGLKSRQVGKKMETLFPPQWVAMTRKGDRVVLKKNQCIESFEDWERKKGVVNHFKVLKFPLGTQGKSHLIGGLAVNISSLIEARTELIKERNRFLSFSENAPLLAWIIDEKGVLQYMNQKFAEVYHYKKSHLHKKIGTVTPISEKEKILLPHPEVYAQNKTLTQFHEWKDKTGKMHYFRTFIFPIMDGGGNKMEGGQAIEITDEIVAQLDLKKSYELFEYAGLATRDVIWEWDVKHNTIRRTGGYETLFGHKMKDVYETQSFERIYEDDLPQIQQNIEDAFRNKSSRWQMEYRYQCADGSYKIVIDQAYIIRGADGKPVRVIGSMQDVTEERNLQAQVLLTEIQKNKDVVSAVIAAQEKERNELAAELHDNVNQLLAATILYLKTAQKQETIDPSLVEHGLDYVQKAINELRSISHNLTPSELKMNGLSAALIALTEKLHIPKTFKVHLQIDIKDEQKLVKPLQLTLYRIVQEEINNILKHANATRAEIHLVEENDIIHLKVSDNGKGFEPAAVKQGLGIANIYSRAENFGGYAQLVTAPGKGCTWHIRIPLG